MDKEEDKLYFYKEMKKILEEEIESKKISIEKSNKLKLLECSYYERIQLKTFYYILIKFENLYKNYLKNKTENVNQT